ncbi:hypothetical protein AX15_002106 [Amanita polypyramis BW_CC]|nr:hypothetical protein AX15_002106 [Amanita polypyramis BW_CC]
MVRNRVESPSFRRPLGLNQLPEQFHPIISMFQYLCAYFVKPWHILAETITDQHRFHGHNALQYCLLNAIKDLKDEIPLEKMPLGVNMDNCDILPSRSYIAGHSDVKTRPGDDSAGNDNGSRKKQKTDHPLNADDASSFDDSEGATEGNDADGYIEYYV